MSADFGVGVADLAQDLIRLRTGIAGGAADVLGEAGDVDRRGDDLLARRGAGCVIGRAMPRCLHLRIGEDLVDRVDRAAGDAGRLEQLDPVGGGLGRVISPIAALIALRSRAAALLGLPFRLACQSGRPIASQNRSHRRAELAAMLMWPSLVGNTPVGMPVGWSLPAWPATSPSISQRAAWKSSMKICASSSEVVTQRPTPVRLAVEQRHHDAEREQVAGGEVVDRDADAHRPLARAGR